MEMKGIPPSPEAKVLDFIRESVTLDRIKEVEEILSDGWLSTSLLNVKKYFDMVLMEIVYRGHRGQLLG